MKTRAAAIDPDTWLRAVLTSASIVDSAPAWLFMNGPPHVRQGHRIRHVTREERNGHHACPSEELFWECAADHLPIRP